MPLGPDVYVHDTETGHDYYVSEARFRNPPKAGLWERLDQGKPKTTVADAAAKKQAKSGHESADPKKEI
jgi:hypothetical protein